MQVLGIVEITWLGKKIPVEKGAQIKLGGVKNNVVVAGRQVGRAGEFEASEITATTFLARGQRVSDWYASPEGELQVLCDTGQTYTFPDAFLTDRQTLTSGEGGKIELKWAAADWTEMLNG